MRILFLSPQPFLRDRGTPIRVLRQLEQITRMGHEVDLLCYPFGADVALPGLAIHRSPRVPRVRDVAVGPSLAKGPLDALLCLKAFWMCLRRRYRVIHCVEEAGFSGMVLARLFRCRFIYNMDSHLSDQLRFTGFLRDGPLLRTVERLERAAIRRSDAVVTVGPIISDYARSVSAHANVVQLEDAPLTPEFEPDEIGAERLRAQLGIGRSPAAVYVGNFRSYQGVDILVRAAPVVARRRPDVRIVLAGGSPEEVTRMRHLARDTGAEGTCAFAGNRPMAEMPALTTMAATFVVPRSRGTNPPLKLYPAMQSRRPIVATRVPSNTQVLDDSCAFLAAPEPEALGNAIADAFDRPEEATRRAAAARKRLDEQYSVAAFHGKVRRMYEALERLDTAPAPPG